MEEGPRQAPVHRLLLLMTALFAGIHGFYFALGVRPDPTVLTSYWQFVDLELLQTRLVESIWYLHSQPPLHNLVLGLVLELFADPVPVLHLSFLGMGLGLYLSLFLLMLEAGVSRRIAFVLSTLFLMSPSFVLYEHWLYQTFPVTFLLTLSVLYLARTLRLGTTGSVAGFVLSAFLLCMTWGMFHLAYFVLAVAVLVSLRPGLRRKTLLVAAIPGLLLLGWYGKNLLLFGQFTASSWAGMNAWGTTGKLLPDALRQELVDQGRLPRATAAKRFQPLDRYPPEFSTVPERFREIPVVSRPVKASGDPNMNHIGYVALSRDFFRGALTVAREYPTVLATGVKQAWYLYFASTSNYWLLPNRELLAGATAFWDRYVYGASAVAGAREIPVYWTLMLGLPALILYGAWFGVSRGVRAAAGADRQALVQYVVLNLVYVAFLSNLLDMGENNRFRFPTDPLSIALLGIWLQYSVLPRLKMSGPR